MAYINGKHIPFIYHGVPTESNVKVVTGLATPESGTSIFEKRDLGFRPDIVIWALYEEATELDTTNTVYAIRDNINNSNYNITYTEEVGEVSMMKPVRLYSDGFTARPSFEADATFKEGNSYYWIAIKSEE